MKTMEGTVTSTKMNKTVVVKVERQWQHPLYKKIVKRSKTYLVQDDIGVQEGERVIIGETRPISKKKSFKVVEKLKGKGNQKKKAEKKK